MSNINIGNSTEKKFGDLMRKQGFWVYRTPNTLQGQPIDFICAKDNIVAFFEIKNVLKGNKFYSSRLESNQHASFNLLKNKGCTNLYIAIYFHEFDDWNFIKYEDIGKVVIYEKK